MSLDAVSGQALGDNGQSCFEAKEAALLSLVKQTEQRQEGVKFSTACCIYVSFISLKRPSFDVCLLGLAYSCSCFDRLRILKGIGFFGRKVPNPNLA